MRLFSLLLFTLFSLSALAEESAFFSQESNLSESNLTIDAVPQAVVQKVLYLNYEALPERLFKGEVFSLTIKTLSTISDYNNIVYDFHNTLGLTQINKKPNRKRKGRYFYDTFFFKVKGARVKTPDVTASLLLEDGTKAYPTTIVGEEIRTNVLNPNYAFSGVLADSFEIKDYKTTVYSPRYNILVFSATATRSNLDDFNLTRIKKQGFESLNRSVSLSKMTYFVILPKNLESLKFTYFNLKSKKFVSKLIPIIVNDNSVSTQSDLTPIDHTHTQLKISIAIGFAIVGFIIFVFRRKIIYLGLVAVPLIYVAYAAIPVEYACIKAGSNIYLLPMENGTIFETTPSQYSLEVQGDIKNYVKVKLHNDKIGWVHHDDICSN